MAPIILPNETSQISAHFEVLNPNSQNNKIYAYKMFTIFFNSMYA